MRTSFKSTFFLISFLILLVCSSVNGQNRYFEYFDRNQTRTRIDMDTYDLSIETGLGHWGIVGKVKVQEGTFRYIPTKISSTNYFNLSNDTIWFTIGGMGEVFQYLQKTRELSRIDNSFYEGYNFKSPQFIRNDTLYSFGGYGFWNFSTALTYYDKKGAEWEIIHPEGVGPKTIHEGYQGYCPETDIFYSGAAEQESYENRQVNKSRGKDLFGYSFKNNSWEKLGKLNPDIPTPSAITKQMCWTGTYFIQLFDNKLFLIKPSTNEVFEVDDEKHIFLADGPVQSTGDKFFFYRGQENRLIFSITDLRKRAKYYGQFYLSENRYINLYSLLAIFIVIFCIIYLVYRRRRKSKGIGSNTIILADYEWSLVGCIIEKGEVGSLTTQEVNTILNLDSKSLENQRRLRVQMIKELNHKIKIEFNIEDAIERSDSDEDKRLNIYRLKPQAFKIFSNLITDNK